MQKLITQKRILTLAAAIALLPWAATAANHLAPVPGGPDDITTLAAAKAPAETSGAVTIFTAETVVTLDPGTPIATAVAVHDGRILGAGTLEEMQQWTIAGKTPTIDPTYQDDVIVPGFIEAHMHPQLTGIFWQGVYVGRFDRTAPDGKKVLGLKTKQDVLNRLQQAVADLPKSDDAKNPTWLIAWGYQPEFYDNLPLTRADLDPISNGHPMFIENLSMHIYYANSKAFKIAGIGKDSGIEGIIVNRDNGEPTGEIEEISAALRFIESMPAVSPQKLTKATYDAARLAQRVGVTTFADLSFGAIKDGYCVYQSAAADPEFPLRVVLNPIIQAFSLPQVQELGGLDFLTEMHRHDTDRLSVGGVKFIIDGSVQGYTSLIEWPHYFKTMDNGVANISQDVLNEEVLAVHRRGYQVVMHTNGNQATEMAIQALEQAQAIDQKPMILHRIEHVQMPTEAQLQRIRKLGAGLNLFVNHIYYWGDMHYSTFLGPDRARRMNPVGSAQRLGIPFSLHSDASVTPVDPLFSMWVATTRKTMPTRENTSGRVLGEDERISPADALHAVTLGAARLLQQEDLKGSIASGKLADFTVLSHNPLEVASPDLLKSIKVLATVVGGKKFPVAGDWSSDSVTAALCDRAHEDTRKKQ